MATDGSYSDWGEWDSPGNVIGASLKSRLPLDARKEAAAGPMSGPECASSSVSAAEAQL